MTNTYKQLGQLRPSTTTEESIYSPNQGVQTIVKSIIITNTSGVPASAYLYIDDDGATYNETTAILWNVTIPANDIPLSFEVCMCMNNSSGNLAVKTGTANALTFTVFGMEQS